MNAITLKNVDLPNLVVSVDRNPIEALLDTGSERTFMSERYFFEKYCNSKRLFASNQVQVVTAQGEECSVVGTFMGNVEIQNESTRISIIVVKDLQFN